jgi:glycosyltransferase involved in cell wall biosynthesis
MKVLYLGNILPLSVVEMLQLSVAGKKYEYSLIKYLHEQLDGNLKVISASKIGRHETKKLTNNFLLPELKLKILYTTKFPIINDLVSGFHFSILLLSWIIKNLKEKKIIIILNSPFWISLPAIIFKYFFFLKVVSLTIDTPFNSENNFKGIVGKLYKITFKLGHKILHLFSGIIVLNKGVIYSLNLKIPFHLSSIGFDDQKYLMKKSCGLKSNSSVKTIIYAGTLVSSKGIKDLIECFKFLDLDKYELHLYGYGPMEPEIENVCKTQKNIKFFGRLNNQDLFKKLQEADLLINPIISSDSSHEFGFPSKLIEYFLSGTPVLTTNFKALPENFYPFVHFINNVSPIGIGEAIKSVFLNTETELELKANDAKMYILSNHSWHKIAVDLIGFTNSL